MHKLNKTTKGDYMLIGPYDEELLAKVKQLPVSQRQWDPRAKAWRVAHSSRDACQRIVDEHYAAIAQPETAALIERVSGLECAVRSLERIVRSLMEDLGALGE